MNLAAVDALVEKGIADGTFPGAAYAVGHGGRWERRYSGRSTYCPDDPKIGPRSLWDLASLSKVVATTSLAMRLFERGAFALDQPIVEVLPEFNNPLVTFRNLLIHDAGLLPDLPNRLIRTDAATVLRETLLAPSTQPPGDKMVYSDLGMITLATALERLAGLPFAVAVADEVFRPLGMRETGYSPWARDERERCVPTSRVEDWRREMRRQRLGEYGAFRAFGLDPEFIQGEVHDPTAFVLGGVAGHAGLFANLDDLTRFVGGLMDGRVAKPETVALFTARNSERSTRALGWDTKGGAGSANTKLGPRAYGHTGYTGTSIWIDPDADVTAILLTNRVHPDDTASVATFRHDFHNAVLDAAT